MKAQNLRLKEFIDINYKSITSFAAAVEKPVQQISAITRGERNVGLKLLKEFEDKGGLSQMWLMTGMGKMFSSNEVGKNLESAIKEDVESSVYNLKPSFGGFVKMFFNLVGAGSNPEFQIGSEMVDLRDLMGINESTFIVLMSDDIPIEGIHAGDSVVIDSSVKPKNYDLCLIEYKGASVLTRLIFDAIDVYIVPGDMVSAPIKVNQESGYKYIGKVKNIISKK